MRKGIRIAAIALGTLLLLVLIGSVVVSRYSPAFLLEYLRERVESDTHGRYALAIDSLQFSPWSMSVHVGELTLERDTTVDAWSGIPLLDKFDVAVYYRAFDIDYFHLFRYALFNTLEVDALRLVEPSIKVSKNRLYEPGASSVEPDTFLVSQRPDSLMIDSLIADTLAFRELAESGSVFFPVLELGELTIQQGHFALYDGLKPEPVQECKGLNLRLKQVRSNEDAPFSADSLMIRVDTASTLLEKNYARLEIFDLLIDTDSFHVDSLHLRHIISPERLNRLNGHRSFWVSAKVRDLDLQGVHYQRLIADSALVIDKIILGGADITLFRDVGDPRLSPEQKPLPPEIIRTFPAPLGIDTLEIEQANLTLSMQAAKAYAPGQVSVNDMRMSITNVTNLPDKLAENPYMDVSVRGRLMHAAPLTTDYRFMLTSPEDRYWANITTRDLDVTLLNDLVGSQAFITFRSGVIDLMALAYTGNNKANVGEMDFEYHDLKIQKLKDYEKYVADNPHTGFLATLGNMLVPANRNRERKGYKKGVAYYEKEYNRGLVFNTVSTVIAGTRSSLGAGPRNLEKKQAQAAALTDEDIQRAAEEAIRQLEKAQQKLDRQARKEEKEEASTNQDSGS